MRKLFPFLMIFGLLVLTACDSDNGDDASDKDAFIGVWTLAGFSTGGQDITAAVGSQYSQFQIQFDSADQAVLTVVNVQTPNEPTVIAGTYSVSESDKQIILDVSVEGQSVTLSFTYDIVNNNQVTLTASSSTALLMGSPLLLNTSLADPVVLTVARIG